MIKLLRNSLFLCLALMSLSAWAAPAASASTAVVLRKAMRME